MKELVEFIKNKCSQEEIEEIIKELSVKEETKENDVPRTWEEYCDTVTEGYYINASANINKTTYFDLDDTNRNKNILPTKELAEAFLAMMQLMSLRQAWIGEWKPDYKDETIPKYCIILSSDVFYIDVLWTRHKVLSFPTQIMAEEFLKCFKSLIEKAKVLI